MRQIPSTGGIQDVATRKVLDAVKESVEEMRAVRGTEIAPLASTATTDEIISKINEIILRIQG